MSGRVTPSALALTTLSRRASSALAALSLSSSSGPPPVFAHRALSRSCTLVISDVSVFPARQRTSLVELEARPAHSARGSTAGWDATFGGFETTRWTCSHRRGESSGFDFFFNDPCLTVNAYESGANRLRRQNIEGIQSKPTNENSETKAVRGKKRIGPKKLTFWPSITQGWSQSYPRTFHIS